MIRYAILAAVTTACLSAGVFTVTTGPLDSTAINTIVPE
jgi:hypothetical protein